MTECLLAISLGPVQEFIAAARKTRDLWFGSAMLSDVSRAAAATLRDSGATLIFPSPDGLAQGSAVANKLLATTAQEPAALAEAARRAAQDLIRRLGEEALRRKGGLSVDGALLLDQLDGFLEFYAAWVPYSPDSYGEDRKAVERLLAGRKALRDFSPAAGRAGVPKSALDPSRESVIDWRRWQSDAQPPGGTRRGEQLDGISLTKRLVPAQRFVSVSRVAIDPLIRRLKAAEPAALEHLTELAAGLGDTGAVEPFSGFSQFDDFPFDTELFYGEDERIPPERTNEVGAFHRVLRDALRYQGISDPPAYYAVLVADGDRMGELIGSLRSVVEHQQFSSQLVEFAREVDRIVRRHHGALIYSGGDDVLAFLPMDQALICADELRRSFSRRVTGLDGRPATLTVGVAFVHYLEPLADVLAWGREAEGAGKQQRNALSVALHTRSGGQATQVASSWDDPPVSSRWALWVDLQRMDTLPGRAAYELRHLASEMATLTKRDNVSDAIRAEARRILTRKREPRSEKPVQSEHVEVLLARLKVPNATSDSLEDLASELIIARRIANAIDVAEGRP